MEKKGLSTVITTVLIILIVLVAIAIVWAFINPVIKNSSEKAGSVAETCYSLTLEPERCKYLPGNGALTPVSVRVERKSGTSNYQGLTFIFSDSVQSITRSDPTILGELETRTFTFSDLSFRPAFFTIAGKAAGSGASCEEIRPAISCLPAVCGDNEVDAFAGEACDNNVCCSSDCRYAPAACNHINDDPWDDNQTDEPDEPNPSSFTLSIHSPLSTEVYQTISFPYQTNLTFSVFNSSNAQQSSTLEECWYRIDRGATSPSFNCSFGINANNLQALSFTSEGVRFIQVYARDNDGFVAYSDVNFSLASSSIQLNSPRPLPQAMVNNSVPISFVTSQFASGCHYSLDLGVTNITVSCSTPGTFSVPQGRYNFTIYASISGQEVSDDVAFIAHRCPGDTTGNGIVEFNDIVGILNNFGTSPSEVPFDFNQDGVIGYEDIAVMLANFGLTC